MLTKELQNVTESEDIAKVDNIEISSLYVAIKRDNQVSN